MPAGTSGGDRSLMTNSHPYITEIHTNGRRQELIAEAREARLAREARHRWGRRSRTTAAAC